MDQDEHVPRGGDYFEVRKVMHFRSLRAGGISIRCDCYFVFSGGEGGYRDGDRRRSMSICIVAVRGETPCVLVLWWLLVVAARAPRCLLPQVAYKALESHRWALGNDLHVVAHMQMHGVCTRVWVLPALLGCTA